MISVAVSGAAGRMGRLVAAAIGSAADLDLVAAHDPPSAGQQVAGLVVSGDPGAVRADVVVEFTRPDVVMGNLAVWRETGMHAVVGTSGFDRDRIEKLREMWADGPARCLVVPNFSIGAVLMMKLAEMAAAHYAAAEIVELHHDGKVDAPSGTALATAERIGPALAERPGAPPVPSGGEARGAVVAGVPVHAIRLPGLVAHQQVMFGGAGETLTIRHDTVDRSAFIPGVLLAVRGVAGLREPVTLGLETLL